MDIHWMRAGDPGFEVSPDGRNGSWKIGREPGQAWPKRGWGTDFSAFRVAVPELAGFQGKAIYLDADMVVLGDIYELFDMPQKAPWLCNGKNRTDVSLIQCEPFGQVPWWPRLVKMRQSDWHLPHYRALLMQMGWFDQSLTWDWNCCDGEGYVEGKTKLIHFTSVPHQPYKPYASVRYLPHPDQRMVDLFFRYKREADAASAVAG